MANETITISGRLGDYNAELLPDSVKNCFCRFCGKPIRFALVFSSRKQIPVEFYDGKWEMHLSICEKAPQPEEWNP